MVNTELFIVYFITEHANLMVIFLQGFLILCSLSATPYHIWEKKYSLCKLVLNINYILKVAIDGDILRA